MVGSSEQILQQADYAPREATADRIPPGDCEKDGHHKRQVDDGEVANLYRDKDLDKKSNQWNEDKRWPTEVVNGYLFPRDQASAIRHHSGTHGCGCSLTGGFAGWSGLGLGDC
jgi:hypothetical protein